MKKISTKQIGDFKLPNKYWITYSNDYYIKNDGCFDWASKSKKFDYKNGVIACVDTYKEALDIFNTAYHNAVFIEDRITGELVSTIKYTCSECGKDEWETSEDTSFTRKEMEKRGHKFI